MPNRGNGRGRGGRGGRGGNFKASSRNDSIHDRLGKMAVYPKANDQRVTSKRFKFVKPSTVVTSSIAAMPGETKIRMLAKGFLRSYYELFDKAGRVNIESLYNADAFFSFSATYPITGLQTYGRNLLRVPDHGQRISLLVHDKTNIARFLSTFLPTEHLVNYLSNDVPFFIVNPMSVISMQIIVSGVFKDTSETTNPLKAFSRVFVIKQVSVDKQGEPVYEIFNDLFMIQPPTPDQIKRYHHDLQIANRLSQTNQPDNNNSQTSFRTQEDMIKSIMFKTKMNREGSTQLLTDSEWNEDKAMELFKKCKAENKIPQILFAP